MLKHERTTYGKVYGLVSVRLQRFLAQGHLDTVVGRRGRAALLLRLCADDDGYERIVGSVNTLLEAVLSYLSRQAAPPHDWRPGSDPSIGSNGGYRRSLSFFSMSSNTDRMLSRLNDLGYTTLTRPNGNLTQVGVPVDCKAKNLQTVLSFLRSNVEKAAWVRRPE